MPFVTTFILLSILGVIDAGYLFHSHRKEKPLICPLDHPCDVVTESKWARMLGVRNETLGLLYYVVLFVGIVWAVMAPAASPLLFKLLFFAALGGFLFSLFLVYLQIVVIKNYCFYCMISAGISFLLFLNSCYLFLIGVG